MKKLVLFGILMIATAVAYSQAVQRDRVVVEISTGTWCQYCPGAAVAADQLVANGAHVAVIEYHNGDAYVNAASTARNSYYNITGYPTGHFDGPSSLVGGAQCPGSGVYNGYLSRYNSRYAILSPLTIDISGTNSGDNYTIVLSIHKVADVTGTDLRAMLVLTETDIPSASWPPGYNCMTQVNFVERLMAPDYNGTSFSFASGDMQIIYVTFTKTASWVNANCTLIAFVQDHSTKTIYNGTQVALNSLPAPVPVSFTADTTAGCAPITINYTDQSTGVDSYQWSFPGGTPSSSADPNPNIIYNSAGTYDATLTAWSSSLSRGNIMVKPSYLNISSVPDAPAQPTGNGSPVAGTTTDYTTTGGTYATSYSWAVTPADAGIFTGSTTTGSITWSPTFQGAASIKVQGIDDCGAGSYSIDFPVNVTVGIAESTKQKIVTFYPNPAKGILNIISLFKMKTDLKVFNAQGCVVIEKNSLNLNGTYQLDISGLAPGIYYFKILTDDAQHIQKVIVE
jgi:PKD repeat protein